MVKPDIKHRSSFIKTAFKGVSIIEMGVIIVLISIALVPIMQMMGGKAGRGTGEVNVSQINKAKSRQMVAANTIMERSLAGDTTVSLDTRTLLPPGGRLTTAVNNFGAGVYPEPVYYQWMFKDLTYQTDNSGNVVNDAGGDPIQLVPQGNRFFQASLNVYDNPGDQTPSLVLPTYLYRQEQGFATTGPDNVGIVIVTDISGSMQWNDTDWGGPRTASGVASPFLKNRYTTMVNGADRLDIDDNTELDLTFSMPNTGTDPDTSTPFREDYLFPNVLNLPNHCGDEAGHSAWSNGQRNQMKRLFVNNAIDDFTQRDAIVRLCGTSGKVNDTAWTSLLNTYMSRIEASRSAMINMLLLLESNPVLLTTSKLGFVTFSSSAIKREDIAGPVNVGGNLRFRDLRETFAGINRQGPGSILASGSTNISDALDEAADMLYNDNTLNRRIIILISDGDPTAGVTNKNTLVNNYATRMGDGTYVTTGGSNGG
ncbi:MAG: VWA domain-containing protein, partial [Vampirovibrio sp.]|nr:VWA domain-containing protein [Vampirovibrio sp.]